MMDTRVRRIVLVTGCSTGIGRATALAFAKRGYHVFAGVRREADAIDLRNAGPRSLVPLQLDVTRQADVDRAVDAVDAASGGRGLLALVNNAGFNCCSPFELTPLEEARALMETNLFGLARMSQAFIPLLRQFAEFHGGSAKIVNIGSIGSHIGVPWEAWYHASKFAVLGLSESLRNEVHGQGIRVSVVCPGGIRTPFIAKSAEQARAVAAALPAEGRALYAPSLEQLAAVSARVEQLGTSPEKVARRIAGLIEQRDPPFNLLVGADARLMQTLKALLPRRTLHALLRLTFSSSAAAHSEPGMAV